MEKLRARDIIEILDLKPLDIEGGFYRRNIRSDEIYGGQIDGREGERYFHTAIYFLLTEKSVSRLHRLKSDEVFHYYMGDPCVQLQILDSKRARKLLIGPDLIGGQRPQVLCKRGTIQGTKKLDGEYGFTLLGTTMGPGYDDRDFYDIKDVGDLKKSFPHLKDLIDDLIEPPNYEV